MGSVGHNEGLGAHSKCKEKLLESFNKGGAEPVFIFKKIILDDL